MYTDVSNDASNTYERLLYVDVLRTSEFKNDV